jgi:hypothetical protein
MIFIAATERSFNISNDTNDRSYSTFHGSCILNDLILWFPSRASFLCTVRTLIPQSCPGSSSSIPTPPPPQPFPHTDKTRYLEAPRYMSNKNHSSIFSKHTLHFHKNPPFEHLRKIAQPLLVSVLRSSGHPSIPTPTPDNTNDNPSIRDASIGKTVQISIAIAIDSLPPISNSLFQGSASPASKTSLP